MKFYLSWLWMVMGFAGIGILFLPANSYAIGFSVDRLKIELELPESRNSMMSFYRVRNIDTQPLKFTIVPVGWLLDPDGKYTNQPLPSEISVRINPETFVLVPN